MLSFELWALGAGVAEAWSRWRTMVCLWLINLDGDARRCRLSSWSGAGLSFELQALWVPVLLPMGCAMFGSSIIWMGDNRQGCDGAMVPKWVWLIILKG